MQGALQTGLLVTYGKSRAPQHGQSRLSRESSMWRTPLYSHSEAMTKRCLHACSAMGGCSPSGWPLLMLLNMGIAMTAEYTAVGDLFELVIGTERVPIVVIIGVVSMLYTAYGGLYVSIVTDQWQVCLLTHLCCGTSCLRCLKGICPRVRSLEKLAWPECMRHMREESLQRIVLPQWRARVIAAQIIQPRYDSWLVSCCQQSHAAGVRQPGSVLWPRKGVLAELILSVGVCKCHEPKCPHAGRSESGDGSNPRRVDSCHLQAAPAQAAARQPGHQLQWPLGHCCHAHISLLGFCFQVSNCCSFWCEGLQALEVILCKIAS